MLDPSLEKFILLYSAGLASVAWLVCLGVSIFLIVKTQFKSPENFISTIFNAQRAEVYMEKRDKSIYRLCVGGVLVLAPPAGYILLLLIMGTF